MTTSGRFSLWRSQKKVIFSCNIYINMTWLNKLCTFYKYENVIDTYNNIINTTNGFCPTKTTNYYQ